MISGIPDGQTLCAGKLQLQKDNGLCIRNKKCLAKFSVAAK